MALANLGEVLAFITLAVEGSFGFEVDDQMQIAVTKVILLRLLPYALALPEPSANSAPFYLHQLPA